VSIYLGRAHDANIFFRYSVRPSVAGVQKVSPAEPAHAAKIAARAAAKTVLHGTPFPRARKGFVAI
jgi:hypothetical protein